MRRHKRNLAVRAYQRGYLAGLNGFSKSRCPKETGPEHQEWINGWRAGREDQWQGMQGASAVHHLNRVLDHHIHDL